MIKVGEKLPEVTLIRLTSKGIETINLHDLLKGKKVVLFGLPGAFTETCSKEHLPSFVKHADEIKAKGVDEIICVAVNDPIVLEAWEKISNATGKIDFLSDWDATFSKAMDLTFQADEWGLGVRSRRYNALVIDGVLKHIDVEDSPLVCNISRADEILKHL